MPGSAEARVYRPLAFGPAAVDKQQVAADLSSREAGTSPLAVAAAIENPSFNHKLADRGPHSPGRMVCVEPRWGTNLRAGRCQGSVPVHSSTRITATMIAAGSAPTQHHVRKRWERTGNNVYPRNVNEGACHAVWRSIQACTSRSLHRRCLPILYACNPHSRHFSRTVRSGTASIAATSRADSMRSEPPRVPVRGFAGP